MCEPEHKIQCKVYLQVSLSWPTATWQQRALGLAEHKAMRQMEVKFAEFKLPNEN